jgi:hypothetical protein
LSAEGREDMDAASLQRWFSSISIYGASCVSEDLLISLISLFSNYDPPQINLPQNGTGCNGMLPLSATLCCDWRHSRRTINPCRRCNPILSFNPKRLDCHIDPAPAALRLSLLSVTMKRNARFDSLTNMRLLP